MRLVPLAGASRAGLLPLWPLAASVPSPAPGLPCQAGSANETLTEPEPL